MLQRRSSFSCWIPGRKSRLQIIPIAVATAVIATPLSADECATRILPHEIAIVTARQAAGLYELAAQPEGILYVPITVHVVQKSNGSGGIPEAQLAQSLVDLNTAFLPAGMQFCVVKKDVIKSDDWHPLMTGSASDTLRQVNVVPNTINIYFTHTNLFCGISAFTFSSVQGIVCANSCSGVPENPSTLPHEVGHYFDLFHTHEIAFGKECASGVNCAAAGDLVCDTPADPTLGVSNVGGGCQYTGSAMGPCLGDPPYQPDPTNMMSYSLKSCRSQFSAQQQTRALATLLTFRPELVMVACPKQCPGELTLDGVVDQADLGALLGSYGLKSLDPGFNPMADIDQNGVCDQGDLGLLLSAYGSTCP